SFARSMFISVLHTLKGWFLSFARCQTRLFSRYKALLFYLSQAAKRKAQNFYLSHAAKLVSIFRTLQGSFLSFARCKVFSVIRTLQASFLSFIAAKFIISLIRTLQSVQTLFYF